MKESICQDHIRKIRAGLNEVGADCFFAFSYPNIFYSSGCRIGPSDRLAAVIVPIDGDVLIVSPGFEGNRIRNEKLLGEVVTWEEDEDPFDLVAQVFSDKGLDGGRIAVDDELWYRVYERMVKDSPEIRWINGENLIAKARWTKSEEELKCIETAARYTAEGIANAIMNLKDGMNEREFSSLIADEMSKLGGNYHGNALVQSGPNASDPHHPSSVRVLQNGDSVVIDGGCLVDGYNSDISRTLMIGDVGDEIRKAWEILKDAQQVAIDTVKPGVTCESIDAASRDYLEERGYGKYFIHRVGHGIGLRGHEPPYMVNGNKLPLEVGMSFTVEPGIYVPGKFGMRIEDDIAVTQSGPRMLSKMKKDWEITL